MSEKGGRRGGMLVILLTHTHTLRLLVCVCLLRSVRKLLPPTFRLFFSLLLFLSLIFSKSGCHFAYFSLPPLFDCASRLLLSSLFCRRSVSLSLSHSCHHPFCNLPPTPSSTFTSGLSVSAGRILQRRHFLATFLKNK